MSADGHRPSVSRWRPRWRHRGARSNVPASGLVALGAALRGGLKNGVSECLWRAAAYGGETNS